MKSHHLLVCDFEAVMRLSQKLLKMVADVGANSLSLAIKISKNEHILPCFSLICLEK